MNLQRKLLRVYFGSLSAFAPKMAAKKGFRLFQKVRKKNIRPREVAFFEQARPFQIPVELDKGKSDSLHCYELGEAENPLVLLVHGWDSNAGSMSQIAHQLVANGKRVVLLNLPGHAFSQTSSTNLLECRHALTALLGRLNPAERFSVVSHSFGSAVVAYTLSKQAYQIDKLIFLTNPNRIERIFTDFKNFIGLNDKAYNCLLKLTEEKLGEPIETISVEASLAKFDFDQLLLIHDKNDRVLDYYNSLEVKAAIPKAELATYENIGHYKMLWNPDVVDNCVQFLSK